jgi:hypothetical protein
MATFSRVHLLLDDEPAEWIEVSSTRSDEASGTYCLTIMARWTTLAVTGTCATCRAAVPARRQAGRGAGRAVHR